MINGIGVYRWYTFIDMEFFLYTLLFHLMARDIGDKQTAHMNTSEMSAVPCGEEIVNKK